LAAPAKPPPLKSVGAAIEDLAAAMLVWKKAGGEKF
jgi:ornithine cyclodeaminase/alanine dehydrogenase-like protein (mu-crystallin family)